MRRSSTRGGWRRPQRPPMSHPAPPRSRQVDEVRVLRGEPRFGMNDAAVRAMKSARFAPAMKDGKRVKTWLLQSIEFKQN